MIPKAPNLETHPIEREASLHDLPAIEHSSVKSNEQAEKIRQEALARIREAVAGLRASNPPAWLVFESELGHLRALAETLSARNPYELIAERIPADYFALCQAFNQGQREVLDTLFASLAVTPSGYPLNKGSKSRPPKAPMLTRILCWLRMCLTFGK